MSDIERSHYWVFDEEQLEQAISDYCGANGGINCETGDELAHELRGFLNSYEFRTRGMRRGGDD